MKYLALFSLKKTTTTKIQQLSAAVLRSTHILELHYFPLVFQHLCNFCKFMDFPYSNLNKSFCDISECFIKALANSADFEQPLGAVWSWFTVLAMSEYLE